MYRLVCLKRLVTIKLRERFRNVHLHSRGGFLETFVHLTKNVFLGFVFWEFATRIIYLRIARILWIVMLDFIVMDLSVRTRKRKELVVARIMSVLIV
jgi:hypothetical protein